MHDGETGDLRRHRAKYDVIVMDCVNSSIDFILKSSFQQKI